MCLPHSSDPPPLCCEFCSKRGILETGWQAFGLGSSVLQNVPRFLTETCFFPPHQSHRPDREGCTPGHAGEKGLNAKMPFECIQAQHSRAVPQPSRSTLSGEEKTRRGKMPPQTSGARVIRAVPFGLRFDSSDFLHPAGEGRTTLPAPASKPLTEE